MLKKVILLFCNVLTLSLSASVLDRMLQKDNPLLPEETRWTSDQYSNAKPIEWSWPSLLTPQYYFDIVNTANKPLQTVNEIVGKGVVISENLPQTINAATVLVNQIAPISENAQKIGQDFREGSEKVQQTVTTIDQKVLPQMNELADKGIVITDKGVAISENAAKTSENFLKMFNDAPKTLDHFKSATEDVLNRADTIIEKNLIKAGWIGLATVFASAITLYGVKFAYDMLRRWMTYPKLIIDSSKKSWYQYLFDKRVANLPMIFEPSLEKRLNEIVDTTKTIAKKIKEGKTNVGYRNLLLYGAPGTGKTLFATELAKRSGLAYAFMSGSSFADLSGRESTDALDELFAWANKSSGLILFIDKAETFLAKQEKPDPQSQSYRLLTKFLSYADKRSNKCMLVFATNYKDALDPALYRHIDDLVEFPLPGKEERVRILAIYKDIILMDRAQNSTPFVQSVEKELTKPVIEKIADITQGLSGAELETIINNLKTSADSANPAIITKNLINATIAQAMERHLSLSKGVNASTITPVMIFDDFEKIADAAVTKPKLNPAADTNNMVVAASKDTVGKTTRPRRR